MAAVLLTGRRRGGLGVLAGGADDAGGGGAGVARRDALRRSRLKRREINDMAPRDNAYSSSRIASRRRVGLAGRRFIRMPVAL